MKLLPCPFCGGEPEEDGGMFFEFYGHERQDYSIACKKCRAEVRCDVGEHEGADVPCSCHHDTRKICAEKWNRRAAMLQGAVQPQNQQQNIPNNIPANTPCKEAPEHIWLQTAGVWPENGEFSELTWCSDNQHEDDTLYVRADVVAGNSPALPDGWALVPVEPTEGMIAAAMCSNDVLFDKEDDTLFRVQHGEIWRSMLAAAPQQEVK